MKAKDSCATEYLVGIDGQVEALMDLLDYDFGVARCLGIHGPGGIGKTTLAKALFDKLISEYDRYCFLRDVRASSRRDGLVFLQKKLISDILPGTKPTVDINFIGDIMPTNINNIDDGMKIIRNELQNKKVLIVLDDVDHREQLEKLIGKISWLGTGSRVIITTRNKSILESGEKTILYELKDMNSNQALQLYINHAFKGEYPGDNYYDRLSRSIVSNIGGLPLIVKVIGSFLQGKNETVWEDTLEKLRSIAHEEVHRRLKISYDALDFKQKQIFLDIACFSFHEEISSSYIWKDHNFFPEIDVEVLSSLSLINIGENGGFWMHDLLKDLGRHIVYEQNLSPEKRSRLWISEEAVDMVKTKENKENIEALSLGGDPTLLVLTDEDLARLPNLRFLELDGGSFIGDFTKLFSKLRWFSWCHFPPDLIASNLFPQNLVVLQLSEFNYANDWEGWSQIKMLHNLKVLQLTRLNLIRIDLSGCFNLENLIIKECQQLVDIDRSIGDLNQLTYLEIEGCCRLKDLPGEIGLLVNLNYLSLSNCSELRGLPGSMGKLVSLTKLDLSLTSIEGLPCSIGNLVNLQSLSLAGCREIWKLPDSTGNLESLIELDLSSTCITVLPHSLGNIKTLNVIKMERCRLAEFPSAIGLAMKLEVIHARGCSTMGGEVSSGIGKLSFLRILDLSYSRINRVPETIAALPQLEELILESCDELQMLPSLPTSLTRLLVSSRSLRFTPDLSNLTNLVNLLLSDGSEHRLPNSYGFLEKTFDLKCIGKLSKLKHLELCLQNITMSLTELDSLSRLRKLNITGSLYLKLPVEPPKSAMQGNLSSITTFPGLSNLRNLIILKLCGSREKEIQLGGLEQLRHLTVRNFPVLERVIFSTSGLKNLQEMDICDCPMLREIHGVRALETSENQLRPSIGRLSDPSTLQNKMKNHDQMVSMETDSEGFDLRKMKKTDSSGEAKSSLTMDNSESTLTMDNLVEDPCAAVMNKPHLFGKPRLQKRFVEAASTLTMDNSESTLTMDNLVEDPSATMMKKPPLFGKPQLQKRFVEAASASTAMKRMQGLHRGLDVSGHSSLLDTHPCQELINALDEIIPDECKVVIQSCPKFGDTPRGGMLYTDYRDKILGGMDLDLDLDRDFDFDSDTPPSDNMDKVAGVKEKKQVASIGKDVGTDDQVNHILSLMNINDKDKRIIVVIHGEAGIGKTTLAKLVYNQVSCDFDGCSFLEEIKEATQVLGGLQLLQTKLISDVLKWEYEDVAFVNRGIEFFFRDVLCNMRVLIILDDVESAFRVQKLIGDCLDCFASGSRILVTTRNSVVLEEYPHIRTYHVSRLDYDQALQLFRQHASKGTFPADGNFKFFLPLISMAGLPLVIELLSVVFNIKTLQEWNDLIRWRQSLYEQYNLLRILKEGYQRLDYANRQRFLDIACFTTGVDSRIAWYLWYDTSFLPSRENLTPIAKIGENNQLWMHSMLRRAGREIVRGENLTDPGRRSRLFNHEIAVDMIKRKKGTEKVEALCLNFQWHPSFKLTHEDFESMPNIRFLQMDHADIDGDFANVLPNLRWLRWRGCPRHLQATNFHLGNLTILDLSWSKVTKDWKGWGQIEMQNLRVLDLTGCADLLVTPKFSGCQNLVILILERCSQLVKIDHSIGDLKCLVSLNMKFCTELSMLPVEVGHLTALQELLLDGTSVQDIPISIGHLKQLETLSASNCCSLSQLPRAICHLTNITLLSLDGTRITALPDSIGELVRLKHLSLRDCRQIRKLPRSIGNLGISLVELDVSGTGVFKFPDSFKNLQNLKVLRMDSCFFREFSPDIGELTSLEEIHASWCRSLEGGIPSEIGKLHNLRILRLRHSTISSIPAEIHQLSNLRTLDLLHCIMIKELPRLPSSIIVLHVDDELKSQVSAITRKDICQCDEDQAPETSEK